MEITKAYVEIDIGKRTCVACIMGADGGVLKRAKYPDARKDANTFVDGLAAYDRVAACESTAKAWIKTYGEFERRGMPITLANPHRLKMAQSGVKADRIDGMFTWNIWHRKSMFGLYTPANTFMRSAGQSSSTKIDLKPMLAGDVFRLGRRSGLGRFWILRPDAAQYTA